MSERKRIDDWDSDEDYWVCPDCSKKNELEFWPATVDCENCGSKHEFETDYVDAYGGAIYVSYVGPAK